MKTAERILAATALIGALAAATPAEIVKLRDGTLVHGEVVEFDEGWGITLERVDTGGVVDLRWEHLDEASVREIKAARGFTGEEPEPFLVDVTHLVLRNGTTESGVLVEGGRRDSYTLQRRSGVDAFPKNFVKRVETDRAEGLEVYEPDELYQVILDELAPPVDAPSHFALAVACQGARLYEAAREHYETAAALDPELKPELIASRLERLEIQIEDAAETEFLADIRNRLYRKQFDQALAMTGEFEERFPESRQTAELRALEREIHERRTSHYGGRIISDYFSFLGKSLSELARNDDLTIGAATELLEEVVHDEVLGRLSNVYGIDEELVEEMWTEREGGSLRTRSYGTGTFILGDEALEWYEDEDAEELEPGAVEDESLEKRIEEVLRRRQQEAERRRSSTRNSARFSDDGITPDEWWGGADYDQRVDWLTAYFAEKSDHLEIVRAKPRPCRQCNGEGFVDVVNEEGEVERGTCPICKSLKIERIVSFR